MKKKIIAAEENQPLPLTAAEAQMVLNAAFTHNSGRCAAYVVLRLWAGLRDCEMSRLDLQDIDLENGVVRLNTLVGARLVKLHPNAIKMLLDLRERGVLTPNALHPSKADIDQVYQDAGVKPTRNVLRHTAISYHYTHSADAAATSRWAGHSLPAMEYFYNPISREEADLFWNMSPSGLQ